jgi:hypothetical protein
MPPEEIQSPSAGGLFREKRIAQEEEPQRPDLARNFKKDKAKLFADN